MPPYIPWWGWRQRSSKLRAIGLPEVPNLLTLWHDVIIYKYVGPRSYSHPGMCGGASGKTGMKWSHSWPSKGQCSGRLAQAASLCLSSHTDDETATEEIEIHGSNPVDIELSMKGNELAAWQWWKWEKCVSLSFWTPAVSSWVASLIPLIFHPSTTTSYESCQLSQPALPRIFKSSCRETTEEGFLRVTRYFYKTFCVTDKFCFDSVLVYSHCTWW